MSFVGKGLEKILNQLNMQRNFKQPPLHPSIGIKANMIRMEHLVLFLL